jgi:rhodanese-related sulfurtransferase
MSSEEDGSDIVVDPERVSDWMAQDDALQLIDVREPYEREAGYIDGSRHIELVRLSAEAATNIDRERPVVFYCRVGGRSEMAAQALRASGFEAYTMAGGLVRWADEGRPLSPEGASVADH